VTNLFGNIIAEVQAGKKAAADHLLRLTILPNTSYFVFEELPSSSLWNKGRFAGHVLIKKKVTSVLLFHQLLCFPSTFILTMC